MSSMIARCVALFSLVCWPAFGETVSNRANDSFIKSPENASDVPDPEKLRRSTETLTSQRAILRDVLKMAEDARAKKDIVRLECVNEKLTQIKGLLRISEQSDMALQEAVTRQEKTSAEHEYGRLMISRQKSETLRSESEQCLGQLAFRTDENLTVEVEIPDDLPKNDPTDAPDPPALVLRPPLPASPIQ